MIIGDERAVAELWEVRAPSHGATFAPIGPGSRST